MRLFLGLLLGSNILVAGSYLLANLECDTETIKEALRYSVIWSIFFSLSYLSFWLVEPYIK